MIQFIKEETKTQYSKQFTEEILKKKRLNFLEIYLQSYYI